ncbi:MAG: hypothetical protein KME11_06545 [Timaviella obliquedivisa GSE-PSE-MK23-08B]|jgi:hypothetical protein|nr:hypothetical protein [Timaviella obliquedivisa GSE-PSE-MK23-08B]
MVKYTLKEDPEVAIEVPGKDSAKSRDKAMDKLMKLLNEEKLNTNLEDGFGPDEFIEIREPSTNGNSPEDDEIVEAVQTLNNFATLKLKTQESKQEALEIRALVDLLFSDDPISEDEVTKLKEGFKVLKTFAQANIKYREAKSQAETARSTLDRALTSNTSTRAKDSRKDL